MNKQQLLDTYETMAANWGLTTNKTNTTSTLKIWAYYLLPLQQQDVQKAINARALSGAYQPRPAELWADIATTKNLAPPPEHTAWQQAQKLATAINQGTTPPKVHPAVAEAATAGHNIEFVKSYTAIRRQALIDLFETNPQLIPTVPT